MLAIRNVKNIADLRPFTIFADHSPKALVPPAFDISCTSEPIKNMKRHMYMLDETREPRMSNNTCTISTIPRCVFTT